MTKPKEAEMNYIFTRDGFYPEYTGQQMDEKEPLELLYDMGRVEHPAKLSVSGYFLYQIAEAFFKELTALPELELARQKIKVRPTEETVESLLEATPYAIGTEFVDSECDSAKDTACSVAPISKEWIYMVKLYGEDGIWCMPCG